MSASDETQLTPRPKGRALPIELWPQADRKAWKAACQPAMQLKPGGRAGHLRPVTREDHAQEYGYFLGFLDRDGLLELEGPAAANVTAAKLDAYLAELKARVSSMTLHSRICRLRRAATYMTPTRDLAWLAEINKDLALVARPRSKYDRLVLTEVLAQAGLKLIGEAECSPKLTKLARACQVRNGLMLALLAFCPIRWKNFVALETGRNFVKIRGRWWIVLAAAETKEKRADERPVNELLTPFIDRYVSQHKPVLARSADPTPALWLSENDGKPLTHKAVSRIIGRCTLSTTGVKVTPHLFRTSAASTAAVYGSKNPYLSSALLHHTHPSFTNEHYNRASCLSAAESFRKIVRKYELPDRSSSDKLAD
jgi:site-specific recombinase XerD